MSDLKNGSAPAARSPYLVSPAEALWRMRVSFSIPELLQATPSSVDRGALRVPLDAEPASGTPVELPTVKVVPLP